jgi:hypothetical protein
MVRDSWRFHREIKACQPAGNHIGNVSGNSGRGSNALIQSCRFHETARYGVGAFHFFGLSFLILILILLLIRTLEGGRY